MTTAWDIAWQAISDELRELIDVRFFIRVIFRLLAAAIVGGLVGYERELRHKSAGLRTHVLVALGAALFVIIPQRVTSADGDLGRIIQGIAAGVGFIGGGAILKLGAGGRVQGLTTAAGIWLTAALGVAAGCGRIGAALIAALFGMTVLLLLGVIESKLHGGEAAIADQPSAKSRQAGSGQVAKQPVSVSDGS